MNKLNPMARVECSNWPDVCGLNNVTMYPTLKIFKASVQTKDYLGRLDEANVLKSYFFQEVISSVIIGIFSDSMNADAIIFEEVSKHLAGSFLLGICIQECSNEALKTFGVKHSTIITVKWEDPYQPFVTFDGAFNKPTILSFLNKSSQQILPELNPASLPSLLGNSESIVMFFHQQDHPSKYAEIELAKVAARKQFDTTPITWVDASDKGHLGRKILSSYSLPVEGNIPQVVFLNRKTNAVCWYPHTPQFSESLLTDWLDATLTGRERSCADEVDTQENNGRFANLAEKDLIHRNDLVQKSCKMPSEVKDAKTWIRTRV
ncbi:putative thioredoxin domain-containing protein 16 isoform X4 [Apostichopus japonicus]|uniref:Putative thioredoxin domain-containing protein 16 isoform X4 n=1 Tax=Stichopus japonicus TaxID=307972 RepID=A0A2G8KWW0_STIJA|nr:putative thioredoxin domain-containing protein 16 isoform X4 [Apostichopus japonicus]